MKRIFIALSFPSDIVEELAALQFGLRGAKWVPSQNFHVTLSFIGDVSIVVLDNIIEMLRDLRSFPFCIKLQGINHFSSAGRVRSVWVNVTNKTALSILQKKIKNCLLRNNVSQDKREFNPHVTLARLKNARPEDVAGFIQFNNLFKTRSFLIESFTLFESIKQKDSSVYSPIEEFQLVHCVQ